MIIIGLKSWSAAFYTDYDVRAQYGYSTHSIAQSIYVYIFEELKKFSNENSINNNNDNSYNNFDIHVFE